MTDENEQRERLLERIRRDCGPAMLDALSDPKVVEIIRNPDGRIWLDVAGQGLIDSGHVMRPNVAASILKVCASLLDSPLTRETPILEGEFPLDGSRLQGLIEPLVDTPTFAIRKHAKHVFRLEDYAQAGMLRPGSHVEEAHGWDELIAAPTAIDAIKNAILNRANILVVGGTGSGKTTLANAINLAIAELCPTDRVVAIEDTKELQLSVQNHVILRATAEVSMQRLLRATMRLRPDRIVVGEVRGSEAYTLLKAWNSGHPGGFATLHADSAQKGLQKLSDYVFEAPEAQASTTERIGRVIAGTVQLVLFIERLSVAPWRAVSEVCRIRGYSNGSFDLQPLLSN